MNSRLIGVLVVLAVITLGLIGVGAYLATNQRNRLPPRDDVEQGRREVIAAFKDRTGTPEAKDFQPFFDDFGKCLKGGGGGGERYWDLERYAREIDRDKALTRAGVRPDHPSFLQGMRNGVTQMMANLAVTLAYDATEIRAVKWLIPGREAVVITRHTATILGELVRFKMRWWLINDGTWRVYDLEDVSVGGRISVVSGSVLSEILTTGLNNQAMADLRTRVIKFQQAQSAILEGEFDNAERLLADPGLKRMPKAALPLVTLWKAVAACRLNKFAECLRLLDEVERDLPDTPLVYFLRAACYASTEDWENTLVAGRRYVELIGADEDICNWMGNALYGLERHDEAAIEYGRALDDIPDSETALLGLIVCLKKGEQGELTRRFERFPDPASHLRSLVDQAEDNEEFIEALVEVVRKKSPNHPEGLYEAGRLALRKNEFDAAIRLVLQAVDRGGEQRASYLSRFAWAMAERGKATEAYAALSDADASAGFKSLAEALENDVDDEDNSSLKPLEELVQAHRKRMPSDVWLVFYDGVLQHHRRKYDLAEKAFADGMGRELDASTREQFRWRRVENLADAGHVFDAYARVGPRRDSFAQLAGHLYDDSQLPKLGLLLWFHGWAEPQDPALLLWRGDYHFRGGRYETALADLKAFRAAKTGEDHLPYEWRVKDQVVRSLLRLKRLADARSELRPKDPKTYYNRVLDVAITAASGDVAKTEHELDELIKSEQATPASLHADPDLGPILKTAPFAKLLEKYPPPKVDGPGFKKA